jgi:hypothetical protein
VKTDLLDHLMTEGYEPDDNAESHTLAADLVVSGIGTIRVIRAEGETTVHAFDRYMVNRWTARFQGAPDSIVIAALESAELELAGLRGGPITPSQVQPIR